MAAKRILVVDDSPIELKLTTRILTQAGYDVLTATDGAQALSLARESRPDLIVLDINMPYMDGYEVCRRVREEATTRSIPIVLYSVRDRVVDVLRGLEAGADDFITKGAGREEMLARIRRLLSGSPDEERSLPPVNFAALEEALARTRSMRIPSDEAPCATAERSSLQIASLLEDLFHQEVRSRLNAVLGVHPTFLLIERALRRAAERSPLLAPFGGSRSAEEGADSGDEGSVRPLLFDRSLVRRASPEEVIAAFTLFGSELLAAASKLARTRLYGSRELDELVRAFKRLLEAFAERVRALDPEPSDRGSQGAPSPDEVPTTSWSVPDEESLSARSEDTTPSATPTSCALLLDGKGIVQNLDEEMARILGYARAEVIGRPLAALVPEDAHDSLRRLLQEVKVRGHAGAFLPMRRRNGTRLELAFASTALFDAHGHFVMSQHAVHPRAEESAELERLRSERDEARRALKQREKEIADAVQKLAHDLRQPLQIIVNAVQLLEEEHGATLTDSMREYLTMISHSALRLRDLLGEMMTSLCGSSSGDLRSSGDPAGQENTSHALTR